MTTNKQSRQITFNEQELDYISMLIDVQNTKLDYLKSMLKDKKPYAKDIEVISSLKKKVALA